MASLLAVTALAAGIVLAGCGGGGEKPAAKREPALTTVQPSQPTATTVPATPSSLPPPGSQKILVVESLLAVQSGPTAPSEFTLNRKTKIDWIRTYHWFNNGAGPGTIALRSGDGTLYGPWPAVGAPGQGNKPNAYWDTFPNVVLPAGSYKVEVSSPETWSHNAETGGRGMVYVYGTPA